MKQRLILSLAAAFLLSTSLFAQQVFTTTLIGPNEPNGGDPHGSGTAVVVMNGTAVTFLLTAQNLGSPTITGAHIHRLATGSIVVPFPATFTNGVAIGTTNVSSQALADEIASNPTAFYVNVHTSQFPGGAIRGTLMNGTTSGPASTENPSTCTPSDTMLCLSNSRFRVEATWKTTTGDTGSGHSVSLTSDSGAFWFFTPTNLEITVKVLNACSISTSQWVFASGMTNVQVVLKVTDTKTGNIRTYTNSLGSAFVPIQDTAAFACP